MLRNFRHIFSVLLFFSLERAAFALEALPPPSTSSGASTYTFIRAILSIIIKLAIPVLVILLVFFAFQMVTAMGDEKILTEAKQRLRTTLIVAAVFLSLGIIASVVYNTGDAIGYVKLF